MPRKKSRPGDVFANLTIVAEAGVDKYKNTLWRARCHHCGCETVSQIGNLKRAKSCGCLVGAQKNPKIKRAFSWITSQRDRGLTWEQVWGLDSCGYKQPRAMHSAYTKYLERQKRKSINGSGKALRVAIKRETVAALTKEGLSAREIADRLGTAERAVVRYRAKGPLESTFKGDFEKARRLRLFEGANWKEVDYALGHPYSTLQELELAFNRECDLRAGLFAA